MKKRIALIAFTLAVLTSTLVSAKTERDCSKDYLYDRQQSLVKYHYTDSDGKKTEKTYGRWSDVPDTLKKMCWECWVDSLGWYNCKEVVGKNEEVLSPVNSKLPRD